MRAREGLGDSRSLDFILNVMTLPQALKRHSDRARIPSYCYERRRIERKNEREKEKGHVLAVTSAVESLRGWNTEGGLKVGGRVIRI